MTHFITIDSHECQLRKHYNSHSHIKFSQLDVGDIILYKDSIPVLVIERKTLSDLYSSIKDGRWREQKARLLSNFPSYKIVYLIEDMKIHNHCLNMKTIIGSIINTLLRDNIKIIFSKSIEQTCLIIDVLFERLIKNPEFFDEITEKKVNYSETLKLKKKDNLTPQRCQELQLAQIPGISVHIAKKLLEKYGTLKQMLQHESIDPTIQITDKRKLGKVLATRIQEYLLI